MVAFIPPKQAGKYKAVASGAITNGKPVLVHTDGTVKQVAQTVDEATQALGTNLIFETGSMNYVHGTFDSDNNKCIFIYSDVGNSSYQTAVVCTIASNGSMSAGTPVVYASYTGIGGSVTYTGNSKIVALYKHSNNFGYAVVGTISGTSISFGSAENYDSGQEGLNPTVEYDSNADRVVVAFRENLGSDKGSCAVGTISGTSISFGSRVYFNNAATGTPIDITFDSNSNKMVISFVDSANGSRGTSVVGTVSGTSISFGSEAIFNDAETGNVASTFDSVNNKIIVAYKDKGDNNEGKAVVGTVSSTSISFGSEAEWLSSGTFYSEGVGPAIDFDPNANRVVIAYNYQTDSFDGEFVVGTVSGTNISFSSKTDFDTDSNESTALVFDSNVNKFALAFRDSGNSNRGTVRSLQLAYSNTTNTLTSENYIGIASGGTYADTAEATIDVVGTVNKDQSGLTAGQTYYVQNDGTLGTSADDPSVVAGTAISATELIVKG